jgi:iron complex outermembrane recepter protein
MGKIPNRREGSLKVARPRLVEESSMKTDPRTRYRRPQVPRITSLTAAVLTALYGAPALAAADDNALQEVVVTASRRAVSAQDLPISITAITGDSLEQAGIEDISGLAHSVAGVNYTDKGPFGGVNGSTLIIRGLNSEATAGQLALASPVVPPVATYVDETPLFVNLRLQDLDHVEILRGPQGTLYGSGSLGGTIRFVQNAPDPNSFDAKGEVGLSKTDHTHALNEDINGMLNLPFSDTFAVRLNASWTDEAGFINQPNLYVLDGSGVPVAASPSNPLSSPPEKYSQDGVNAYEYRSARVSALWKPGDGFKAQLSYYYQVASAGGFPYAATSSLAYTNPIAATNPYPQQMYNSTVPAGVDALSSATNSLENTKDKVDLMALTLEYDMGFATMTSSSSYAHHNNQTNSDITALYTNFFFWQPYYGNNPRSFVQGHDQLDDKPWSEEIRLASKTGGTFDWVGGLFFKNQNTIIREHEFYPGYDAYFNNCLAAGNSPYSGAGPATPCGFGEYYDVAPLVNGVPTVLPASGGAGIPLVKDQTYVGDFETHFKDLAVFGELTWHLTSAWNLTGGARLFKQTLTQSQQTGLLFDGPAYAANESGNDQWRRALWKINTSYELDKSNLIYATWSQGFRRGGVNALPPGEPAIDPRTNLPYVTNPALFKLQPDTADNYEMGMKGTVDDHFRYSAAIYDIEWHNIQEGVQLTPLVLPAALNIGEAFSRGLELEFFANITKHLSGQLGYTYDQTKLKSINPLFQYPDVSVPPPTIGTPLPGTPKTSLALGLEYGQVALADGDLRFAVNGHYQSSVVPALSATVPTAAGFAIVDSRATFTRSHWAATLYVNNLANKLGITSYTDPSIFGNRAQAVVSTPRTVGVTIGYSFKER